jgi:hypothetical protein
MSDLVEGVTSQPAAPEVRISPLARAVAMFVRPTRAWEGLRERSQWWFPMVVMILVGCAGSALLQERAVIPMMSETWDEQVQSGRMTAQAAQQMEEFFASPGGYAVTVGQQIIAIPVFILIVALVIWFGVGFVLGTGLKYRVALEVAAWGSLINLPAQIVAYVEAWFLQTFKGVHVGLGALLPGDSHAKLIVGLRIFLDSIGPFSIWYLFVTVLGAAALSGAPRKSVAWVLTSLYLVVMACVAVIAALFAPGS